MANPHALPWWYRQFVLQSNWVQGGEDLPLLNARKNAVVDAMASGWPPQSASQWLSARS
jgi:hypothetical protein